MAGKSKFGKISSRLIDSLHRSISQTQFGSQIIFEDRPDESCGLIGRFTFSFVDDDFCGWLMLNKEYNWDFVTIAIICPIADDSAQSLKEINLANDELAGVKVTFNAEENAIAFVSEIDVSLVDNGEDRLAFATIRGLMAIVGAIKKVREIHILRGIYPFLGNVGFQDFQNA